MRKTREARSRSQRRFLTFLSVVLIAAILHCLRCSLQRGESTYPGRHEQNDLPVISLPAAKEWAKISDRFKEILRNAPADKKFKVLVDFKEQIDISRLRAMLEKRNLNKIRKREEVIRAFQTLSRKHDNAIKPAIDEFMKSGDIEYYRKFSIVNRFYIIASRKAILTLADREDIQKIIEEYSSSSENAGNQFKKASGFVPGKGHIEENWALTMMGADIAWKRGFDGSGVVIGSLDTGIWPGHEQLKENFRGGDNSWFDPVTGSASPFDSKGHGTGVLSCAAGKNVNNNRVGVAPNSKWIAAMANYKNYYNNIFMTYAADWMFTVGKPDIIVNAWSHGRVRCDRFDIDFINAWKAAEIFPVFSAGNQGPREESSESPADLLTSFPENVPVLSVGSIDSQKNISRFSSRGPSRCAGTLFPMIVAPGEDVFFAFPIQADSYMRYSGTSSATGYAAGVIALIIQKFPEMGVHEIEQRLKDRAVDLGTEGPDNDYGFGLISIPALLDLQQ